MTVNNLLACVNTKLLADYVAIDPRVAQLVGGCSGGLGCRSERAAVKP